MPKPLWAHYLGGIVGQALYLWLFSPPSPLMAVGLMFLLVWSLLLLVGAYAGARTLRFADGPDEVHRNAIAKWELGKYAPAKADADADSPVTRF